MRLCLFRRRVVVTKKNGKSVMGVLWSRLFGIWVLKSASIESEGKMVPADGEVVVMRENIDHVQVLP